MVSGSRMTEATRSDCCSSINSCLSLAPPRLTTAAVLISAGVSTTWDLGWFRSSQPFSKSFEMLVVFEACRRPEIESTIPSNPLSLLRPPQKPPTLGRQKQGSDSRQRHGRACLRLASSKDICIHLRTHAYQCMYALMPCLIAYIRIYVCIHS